jgi:hypothetical protein
MGKMIQGNPWVWVVVMDPGENEQFLGQYNQEKEVSYIPTFLEKEEALQSLENLAREPEHKYEVQAIQYEDLARNAAENGFMVFILNAKGEILEKISP